MPIEIDLPYVRETDWRTIRSRLALYLDAMGLDEPPSTNLVDDVIATCRSTCADGDPASLAIGLLLERIEGRPPGPHLPTAPRTIVEQRLDPIVRRVGRRTAA